MHDISVLSTSVALGIIGLISLIIITSIIKYHVDDALKIISVLAGLIGVVTGTISTYFFTREPIALSTQRANEADARAITAELKLANLESKATNLASAFNKFPDQADVATLRKNVIFSSYLDSATNKKFDNVDFNLEYDPATGQFKFEDKSSDQPASPSRDEIKNKNGRG